MAIRLHYATVYVEDQDRALEFYTGTLGFEVRQDNPMGPGQRWLEVAPPGASTTVLLYRPSVSMPGAGTLDEAVARIGKYTGVGLRTDDIASLFRELRSAGADIVEEPKQEPWGWQGIFADPDGNRFVVVQ